MSNAIAVASFTVSGAPVAPGSAGDDFVGGIATLNLSFSNGDPSQPGYAPFIDLVLPAGNSGVRFEQATYLGEPVQFQSAVFDANGHANSPIANNPDGTPVVIDGPPGATLVTLTLPFGSFTPGQIPANIAVQLGVSPNAVVGTPLDVTATGGFAFGNSPTGVTASNPALFGSQTDFNVVPQIVTLATIYSGPEQETATGPSYPHSWDSVATIAPGQTLTGLVLTQKLPDGAVFLPGSSALLDSSGNAAGTVTYDAATNTVTGTFTSPETGSPGNTPTLQVGFYVTQDYTLPQDGTSVLDPTTGSFTALTDTSSLSANWHSTNPANPVTVSAGPVSDTITAKSIAIQNGVTDLSHGASAIQPGDTLQYSLAGEVSNYFDVNHLVITDTLGDGQTFQAGATPAITIADNGTTLFSGTVAADEFTVAPKAADGTTTIVFDVSKILTDHGQAGDLDGGTAAHPNPATVNIVFDTTIDQTYSGTPAPAVSTLVDQGDTVGNSVVFSGAVAASGDPIADTSGAAVTLPTNTVTKSVYAVNGVRVAGPVTIQAGDLVTYDLKLSTPLTSTHDVKLTDFLPLPTFTAGTGLTFNAIESAAAPALGTADFGPANTFAPIVGQPVTVSADATANSLTFNLGSYTDQPASSYPAELADILYTVRAGDAAFADGLLLTNQVHATETNSFGIKTTADAIVQVKLGEPELKIEKAATGSTDPNAVLSGDAGPTGLVNDGTLAADPLRDTLSGIVGGDSVGFKVVVQNTGSGPNGAFNVVLHDTIPVGFATPTNVRVTDGAGNPLAYTDIGGGLFDPNGGIMLTDPSAAHGALAADSATSGANIAVITYDAVAAATVPVPHYDLHNVATITNYAAEENGTNHTAITPAGNLTASSDVYTAVPVLAKAVISTSAVAPNADGTNNLHDLAIGETATYDITLTLTKGTAEGVTISDLLPSGAAGELDLVSAVVKSIGSDVVGSKLAVGDISGDGRFDFGSLTDGSNAQGAADQVVVEVTALAVDKADNRGGDTVTNTAVLSETNPNDPGDDPYTQVATATETLVEPSLHLLKTSDVHTVQAGDTVTYTLAYTNTGSAAAYGTVITDPLDQLGADAAFNEGSVRITGSTATGAAIVTGNTAGDSSVTVNVAEIDPGQTVNVTYTASVLQTAATGTGFLNAASLTASTLPGTDPLARTEAASGADTVRVQDPTIVKALIAGSDPNIPVPGLTAGETGTFQLTVTVPHGSEPHLVVADTLPGGLTYVPGSATIVSVGSGVHLAQQAITESGQVLTVDFGNVTDSGTGADSAADQIVIDYRAAVDPTAANGAGAILTNTADVSSGGTVLGIATATPVIVAPHLTLTKAADLNGAPPVAGTDVHYTLTLGQAGTGPAYNVTLADLLPADETYDPGSLAASAGTATYSAGGISFTDPLLLVGAGPVTITYSATLNDTVTPGEQVTNTASVTAQTQPAGGYTEPAVTASATVLVDLTPTIAKTILSLSNPFSTTQVVTGETVTYQLLTTVQPGTQHLQVWDYPVNLTVTGATLVSVGANITGSALTPGPVTPGYNGFATFDFGTVTAAPGTGPADQIVLDVTGTVNLVPGGTSIDNIGFGLASDPGGYGNLTYGYSFAPTLTDVKSSLSGTVFTDGNDDGVADQADAGLAGVKMELLDGNGNDTGTSTVTDASGHYSFTGLEVGTYAVQVAAPGPDGFSPMGTDANPARDSIVDGTGRTAPVTLNPGADTPNQNAGVYAPATLSGRVFNDSNADGSQEPQTDAGVAGDTVQLLDAGGTPIPGASTTTDANGAYSFTQLKPGTYSVLVTDPAGDSFSPKGTSGTFENSIVDGTGHTPTVTLASGGAATAQDAGVYGPVSLSGTVFTDANADGTQEAGDHGYGGDTVQLLDGNGRPIPGATTTTAADGTYSFTGLKPGTYAVQVTGPAGDRFSPAGTSATLPDSIVNGTGATSPVTLTSGQSAPGQNAGVYQPGGISGNVFLDQNGDGAKQPGEANQPGDTVNLLDGAGHAVATATTDAQGNYSFGGLTPGSYGVQVVSPAGTVFSPAGTSTTLENSIVGATGRTPTITITSGADVTGQDAGDYLPATVAGTAFLDAHCDGVDDYGDPAFKGVTVKLYDGAGTFTGRTAVTDANGRYSFGALQPGAYQVQFVDPAGTTPSYARIGNDNLVNSDQLTAEGFSEVFTVTSGATDATHGLGLHLTGGYANSPTTTLDATTTTVGGNGAGITVIGGQGPQADIINGGNGNNILVGGNGSNTIESGAGNNLVLAGCGPYAQIQGLGTNDFIFGGPGNDLIQGHSGNEYIAAGVGNQTIYGAGGDNTFIANANSGTITDTAGVFSNITVGDHFTTGGNTNVVYDAGDGVIWIDDYDAARGDTLTVNGYTAPTAIGDANGYGILYFGPNAAVLLAENTGRLTATSPVPAGVTFNATVPIAAPLTVSIDASGFFTLTQAGAANPIIGPTPGPTITGAVSGQTTADQTPVTPFFGVTIGDTAPAQTETVTIAPFSQGLGSFAALGGGSVTNGSYSITGVPAAVTAAVDALQWVPTLSGIGVGQSLTAQFRITATDTAGLSASNTTASVAATKADVPPSISGTVAGQAVADTASLSPFAGLRVTDPDGGLVETATVTLSSTGNGTLGNTNSGSYDAAHGVFTVSGSAQSVSAALEQLTFRPVAHEGAAVTTGFTVTVVDALGGSTTDATTSVVAAQGAAAPAPVTPTPPLPPAGGSVALGQGQSYTGGDASVTVVGSPNGNGTVTLGNGNDTVALGGYGNTVHVGTGTDTIDGGYGATVTAAGGNQAITLEGYGSDVTLTGAAVASVTGGDGNSTVTLDGGTGVVRLSGYNNVVTATGGANTINTGFGAHVTVLGGSDTISLEGYSSQVFIGGAAQASIMGGLGNSQITTAGGTVTIGLAGYNNVVNTQGAADTITDSAVGNSQFNVGGAAPGLAILHSFAADANSVVNVLGASAAGYSAASLFGALTVNASGSAQLALPNDGGTVVFDGLAPSQLHAANFRAG